MKPEVRILIIDDCLEDAQIYQQLLKKSVFFTYHFVHALNVHDALHMIESHQFDCIILDHFLPGTTGIEMLEMISNHELRKPVIFLTGSNDTNLDLEAMQKGALDFIEKADLTSKSLERSIRYAIECQKHINHTLDLNQVREEFFGKICTKLKNPIKAIISYCDLFLSRSEGAPSGPHIYDLIKYINQCSKEQLKSIDEIIKENFINDGTPVMCFQQINLTKLLEFFRRRIKGIIIYSEEVKDLTMSADKPKIASALRILLREARKFANKDPLEIRVAKKNEKIEIVFTLKNCTMKESDFDELFVPYHKHKSMRECAAFGDMSNGIDLAYAKRIVELHSGRIEFQHNKKDELNWFVIFPCLNISLPRQQEICQAGL